MKYIIEFEDEYSMNEGGMKYHQCKQVPYWSVSHGIIKNLTPYTEPDLNPLVDEAVETIENEVWEFVRIITDMTETQRKDCFGGATCNLDEYMTYQEAKAKHEAWLKQKEEIRVGDEVETESGNKACVLYENPDGTQMFVFKADGTAAWWSKCAIHKTGKNHPEVAELLEKMRGES